MTIFILQHRQNFLRLVFLFFLKGAFSYTSPDFLKVTQCQCVCLETLKKGPIKKKLTCLKLLLNTMSETFLEGTLVCLCVCLEVTGGRAGRCSTEGFQ